MKKYAERVSRLWRKISPGQRLFEPDGLSGQRNFLFFGGSALFGGLGGLILFYLVSLFGHNNLIIGIVFLPLLVCDIAVVIGLIGALWNIYPALKTLFPYRVVGVGHAFTHVSVNSDGTASISNSGKRAYWIQSFLRRRSAEQFMEQRKYRPTKIEKDNMGRTLCYVFSGED